MSLYATMGVRPSARSFCVKGEFSARQSRYRHSFGNAGPAAYGDSNGFRNSPIGC